MLVIDFILSTIGLYKVVKCAKKDEEGYYVIGKKEPSKIYLKDFEKKLEKYKKDWQYLCEQKE
jgi:hypothetical protein